MKLTLQQINTTILTPALALLPAAMDSAEARAQLLATTLQEDPEQTRAQVVIVGGKRRKGPARGLWQFERGTAASRGGVWGVVLNQASRYWLAQVCKARGCEFTAAAIWAAIETDDILAAALARLLLFTDPKRLPALGESEEAWKLYRYRTWRPGKPHPENWPANYAAALRVVKG